MPTVEQVLQDKITLEIQCVDRVLLNGYVPHLQMPGGLVNFIREQMDWPIPSPQAMGKMTQAFRQSVEEYAKSQGLEVYAFKKGEDKDAVAKAALARLERCSGVVLIGAAQEKTNGYKSKRADRGSKVWFNYSRQPVYVTHYYFYILDEDFGLSFIKVCTYMPFDVKVCFNGHEWAKQQLRKEGIEFKELSNGFATCQDSARLQAICHQLDSQKIQAFFDHWVEQLPWPLLPKHRAGGYRHLLSVWQMEVCRTQVFADAEQGRALVESLIKENLDLGRPDRVSLIFERKMTKATPGELYTRVIREGVLPSIRIHYKHSSLKQYYKEGQALRSELTINNTYDFGICRGLENFGKLVELGHGTIQRLLEQEQLSQDSFMNLNEVRKLTQPTVMPDGQRAGALRFGEQRAMVLLEALTRFGHAICDLSNKTLRVSVAQLLGCSEKEYTCKQMSYDLRRLRLKNLIERIASSHRYKVTSLGLQAATFFSKLYQRVFLPGLSALVPNQRYPPKMAQALNSIDQAMNNILRKASLSGALT